ncbi:MAG TPA: hypothetical protein VHU80_02880 [Polyangiaceae bacterium]|jgi:hypothetical protein|nr:hypothetical protein [Polyangiaceae bacterium]
MPDPIELSHGRPHLARTRQRDLEPIDAERERSAQQGAGGRFVANNTAGAERGAKHDLVRPLRAVRDAVQDATGGALAPEDSREVVRAALRLYTSNRRAVGHSELPVLARLVRAAVNDALATYYTAEAARVGFATEAGLALVDAAHRAEARAERSMTAALAFAKALGGKSTKGSGYAPGFELDTDGEETTP